MSDPVKCKKCKGQPPRINQPKSKCRACGGSGWVRVTFDKEDRAIVTPAQAPEVQS